MIQSSAFHEHMTIYASIYYSIIEDSQLVIIITGAVPDPGEFRILLVKRNVQIIEYHLRRFK